MSRFPTVQRVAPRAVPAGQVGWVVRLIPIKSCRVGRGGTANGMTGSAHSVVRMQPCLVNAAALATVQVDGTSFGMPGQPEPA
jgi:hypothetical protein